MNCKNSLLATRRIWTSSICHPKKKKRKKREEKRAFQKADGPVTKTNLDSGRQGEKCAFWEEGKHCAGNHSSNWRALAARTSLGRGGSGRPSKGKCCFYGTQLRASEVKLCNLISLCSLTRKELLCSFSERCCLLVGVDEHLTAVWELLISGSA